MFNIFWKIKIYYRSSETNFVSAIEIQVQIFIHNLFAEVANDKLVSIIDFNKNGGNRAFAGGRFNTSLGNMKGFFNSLFVSESKTILWWKLIIFYYIFWTHVLFKFQINTKFYGLPVARGIWKNVWLSLGNYLFSGFRTMPQNMCVDSNDESAMFLDFVWLEWNLFYNFKDVDIFPKNFFLQARFVYK